MIFLQGPAENLIITEVYYSALGVDAEREWVEIANLGSEQVSLNGIKIGDEESIWGGEGMVQFPDDAVIGPGQVIIIAQTAVGYRSLYGRDPDYEIVESIEQVPNLDRYNLWSSGDIALANDGDEVLLLDEDNARIDAISYGDKETILSPSIGGVFEGQSIERIPADCDTNTAADWKPQRFPTPGTIQTDGECSNLNLPSENDAELLTIGEIQGVGSISPYINKIVSFRGVVSGHHEDQNADGIIFYSLFAQSVPGEEDGDPDSSDGIAIFLAREKPIYEVGDIVYVKGKVTEFFGMTEIDHEGLEIRKEDTLKFELQPIALNIPKGEVEKMEYYESIEGTLVNILNPALVAGPTHSGCGFDIFESTEDLNISPIRYSDEAAGPILSILHYSDVDCSDMPQVKTRDNVSGLGGPLTYHFDRFKIVQQDYRELEILASDFLPLNNSPILDDFQISFATYNMENYFDEHRDMLISAEPTITIEQQEVKREKISFVISKILNCPSIIAVQEVENYLLLKRLDLDLQARCGFEYQINHKDGPDSRGLDVALLSDPNKVQVLEEITHQTCTALQTGIEDLQNQCPTGENLLFGRPPLQVNAVIEGNLFQIFVVHLKSKRGDAADSEQRRIAQAEYLNRVINENINWDPNLFTIVLGDFNDFEQSETMETFLDNDLLENVMLSVPLNERYSYIFDGRTQLIDGILVAKNMMDQVELAEIFHINADYPIGLAEDSSTKGLPYQSSDHDIPFIILNIGKNNAHEAIEKSRVLTPERIEMTPETIEPLENQITKENREVEVTREPGPFHAVRENSGLIAAAGFILIGIISFLLYIKAIRHQ